MRAISGRKKASPFVPSAGVTSPAEPCAVCVASLVHLRGRAACVFSPRRPRPPPEERSSREKRSAPNPSSARVIFDRKGEGPTHERRAHGRPLSGVPPKRQSHRGSGQARTCAPPGSSCQRVGLLWTSTPPGPRCAEAPEQPSSSCCCGSPKVSLHRGVHTAGRAIATVSHLCALAHRWEDRWRGRGEHGHVAEHPPVNTPILSSDCAGILSCPLAAVAEWLRRSAAENEVTGSIRGCSGRIQIGARLDTLMYNIEKCHVDQN